MTGIVYPLDRIEAALKGTELRPSYSICVRASTDLAALASSFGASAARRAHESSGRSSSPSRRHISFCGTLRSSSIAKRQKHLAVLAWIARRGIRSRSSPAPESARRSGKKEGAGKLLYFARGKA